MRNEKVMECYDILFPYRIIQKFQLRSHRMKGKLIESDTIRGLLATFLNQLVNVSVTIQRTVPASNTDSLSDSQSGPFIYPWGP